MAVILSLKEHLDNAKAQEIFSILSAYSEQHKANIMADPLGHFNKACDEIRKRQIILMEFREASYRPLGPFMGESVPIRPTIDVINIPKHDYERLCRYDDLMRKHRNSF